MKSLTKAEMYLLGRKRKFEDQGRVECKKHRGQYYDPKIYEGCYMCFTVFFRGQSK